jgi:uncharacterized membrane protein HdeD (DUF308 family)
VSRWKALVLRRFGEQCRSQVRPGSSQTFTVQPRQNPPTVLRVVGAILVDRPLRGAEGLTLILAVAFLIAGGARLTVALIQHFPAWNWVLVNGLVTFLLGISIWKQWPQANLWVIGTFVGIDLIFNGWS